METINKFQVILEGSVNLLALNMAVIQKQALILSLLSRKRNHGKYRQNITKLFMET